MSKEKSKQLDIKIMVVNHKPASVPDNKYLKPIQVGAELAQGKLEGVDYFDNTGDNISHLNRSYCELTAVYWAWKNLDADYYGLFHYRRYLSFSKEQDNSVDAGKAFADVESALPEINLDEQYMHDLIQDYDLVVPRKDDTTGATNDKSIYEQYKNEHYIKDLDYCLDYIKEKYPDIAEFNDVLHGKEGYFCNMFIMKKELYEQYCSFMFDVLGSFDENIDISEYSVHQHRVDDPAGFKRKQHLIICGKLSG